MNPRHDRVLLKRLLDLADEIGSLRRSERELALAPAERQLLRRRARERMLHVGKLLKEFGGSGPLQMLLQRYKLGKDHVLLMLELLKRRLTSDDSAVRGRELLSILFDSSFAMLEGVRLIAPDSRLITAGVLVPELQGADGDAELLDLRYRLSDRAFRVLLRALRARKERKSEETERLPEASKRPYRNHLEHITDLRRLARLYQKRAAKLFHFEYTDELDDEGLPESITLLNRQIPRFSRHIEQRLLATPNVQRFPLVAMQKEFGLSEEHLIVLVTIVFQELTQGTPYVDASDLLKLVSRTEEDLVRRRNLFGPKSTLAKNGLVELEEVVLDKELSGEVYVPNEVVDRILGPGRSTDGTRIDEATKNEFKKFLSQIDDSEDFFKRL
jgi:hypothetical protein